MKMKIMVVVNIFDIALLNTFQIFYFFISATLYWVQYRLRIANRTLPKSVFSKRQFKTWTEKACNWNQKNT